MLLTVLLCCHLLLPAGGTVQPPCDKLRPRAEQIDADYQNLRQRYREGELKGRKYERRLKKLRKKEEKIHRQVRACSFTDKGEHNYWYRGRLKFPSLIQQEIARLARDKTDE
jgi:septal ring factor EnvC (AmiA/AmiB activator)